MKNMLKNIVKKGFYCLPWGVRNACIDAYMERRDPFTVIGENADASHVVDISVSGEYGVFQGSPQDLSVLRVYALTGFWARQTNDLVSAFFNEVGPGTFLDIGANIGFTTVPAARLLGIKCHAFEPEPRNYRYLERNVAVNCPAANVKLHNLALFDRKTTLAFELSPNNLGDHRIRLRSGVALLGEDEWETIEVPACPLDDIELDISDPLAVKIDTQGAEPFVLNGGKDTLLHAEFAIIEFSPYWMNRMGSDPSALFRFIRDFQAVQIAAGDTNDSAQTMTGLEAADQMTVLYEAHDGKSVGKYWDLIARRS